MIYGLYRAGASPLHRATAGAKLAALLVAGTGLFLLPSPLVACAACLGTLGLYRLAGFSVRAAFAQIRPALPILAILFLAQLWLAGIETALLFAARFAALILAAALVTLTTRTAAMVGVIERGIRPLARLGVDAGRVALAISLAIRFIPAVAGIVEAVREAQRARGRRVTMLRLAVPVIVRLLKMADEVAEAIDARS